MTIPRDLLATSLAVTLGFVGGCLVTQGRATSRTGAEIVRATRFELVDEHGRTLAFWGTDDQQDIALAFVGKKGIGLASLGLSPDQKSFLTFVGEDGKPRVDLRVGVLGKPFLGLSDEKWRGRALLGFIASDAPSSEEDKWGVAFGAPLASQTLAAIGFSKNPLNGTLNGTVVVKNSTGKVWQAP